MQQQWGLRRRQAGLVDCEYSLWCYMQWCGPAWLPSSCTGTAGPCAAVDLLPYACVQAWLQCWGSTITELSAVSLTC